MLGRIRPNYVRIADILASEGDRIVRIDASKSAEAVAEAVRRSLADLL